MSPKAPVAGTWEKLRDPPEIRKALGGFRYVSLDGVCVISTVRHIGPQAFSLYQISISMVEEVVPAAKIPDILREFDALDFTEELPTRLKMIRSFCRPVAGPVQYVQKVEETKFWDIPLPPGGLPRGVSFSRLTTPWR